MPLIVALLIAFMVGFAFRICGNREWLAWLFSLLVMPIIVLCDEFVLPYRGGGASMWPIAFVVGGFYGSFAGGLGVVTASYCLKRTANRGTLGGPR